jgi:hypothetical protein
MTMLLEFASAGVVLAIVGVYDVLAQTARRRTREMGGSDRPRCAMLDGESDSFHTILAGVRVSIIPQPVRLKSARGQR